MLNDDYAAFTDNKLIHRGNTTSIGVYVFVKDERCVKRCDLTLLCYKSRNPLTGTDKDIFGW